MGTKLTVILVNKIGPFHWSCQHIAAIATDMNTGKTFNINWISSRHTECGFVSVERLSATARNCYIHLPEFQVLFYRDYFGNLKQVTLTDYDKFKEGAEKMRLQGYCSIQDVQTFITLNGGHRPDSSSFTTRGANEYNDMADDLTRNRCCQGTTTLFSDQDFDTFVKQIESKFSDPNDYNCCGNNCADAVSYAIDSLCPKKTCTDVSFWIYQAACFPFFIGTLGLSCFPAPPCFCTTPQDIYNKAKWLAKFTSYGCEATANINVNEEEQESKVKLLTNKSYGSLR